MWLKKTFFLYTKKNRNSLFSILLATAICTYEQNVDTIYYAMGIAMNLFVWFEMNLHTYMIVHVDNTSPNVVILQV
jgi:inner membrane protein involved in colicin E2 resistance